MEEQSKQNFMDLRGLKGQVAKSLLSENMANDKVAFYEALKTLIDIKINEEEILFKFDKLQEVFTEMALGNFSNKIDIPNQKNLFSFLAVSINAVIEELEANVKKNEFVQATIECITEPAIVTDSKGNILFVNDKVDHLLNTHKEILKDLRIANIFENHAQFGDPGNEDVFMDKKVNIRPYNKEFSPVLLTVKPISCKSGKVDGYIYILKPYIVGKD